MEYVCDDCGARHPGDASVWRCERCGGTVDLPVVPLSADRIDHGEPALWRYAAALPEVPAGQRIVLGEVMTPLVRASRAPGEPLLKVDYVFPSGSYKDRGSAVMVSRLRMLGATEVFDDSSGNAGASIAAYAAAGGMRCSIMAPAATSPAKLAQIEAHGARLMRIDGDRSAVAESAKEMAGRMTYASHIHEPLFIAGCATAGYEVWEQLVHRAPDSVIVAVGYGSQLLGMQRAFASLLAGGAIARLPRLYAVQSAAFPALQNAWMAGATVVEAAAKGTTVAEGIACRLPARGESMLAALRTSGGGATVVSDVEIAAALSALANMGYFVEPTGAVSYAGYLRLRAEGAVRDGERNVIVLSGSGLKAGPTVAELIASAG